MLLALFVALASPASPQLIKELDVLAQKRDAAALKRFVSPELLHRNPNIMDFVSTGGSYGVGRLGWHVYELQEVNGDTDAVFSTPLTVEDLGEQVFRWNGQKLTKHILEEERNGVRLLSHNITAHFDINKKAASLEDTVHFTRDFNHGSFLFRLNENYKVSSIRDQHNNQVPFRQAGGVISVAEPRGGGPFTYTMQYGGVVDHPTYSGSVSTEEICLADDYWYPTVGRNAASYRLTAFTPPGWEVIGQGTFEGQKNLARWTITTFHMDVPCVFFSFSSAPFKKASDKFGRWSFSMWSNSVPIDAMHAQNRVESDVIAFYNRTFAPYPFKWWGTVASKAYGQGALEAYSYATYGAGGYWPSEDAHEPSHTWWGGIMPNNYLHSMWNESFANFSEQFYQREAPIGNRAERRRAFVHDCQPRNGYGTAAVMDGAPEVGPQANALGYGKGSAVLAMLEDEIGTTKLVDCMHKWIHAHKHGQLEEWSNFEKIAERETHWNYTWFFLQWLHRPGFPNFEVEYVGYANREVSGKVRFRGQPYRLRLEVLLQFPDGSRDLQVARLSGRDGWFTVPCPRKPSLVSIDPWLRLVRVMHDDEFPVSIQSVMHSAKRYTDPKHSDWLSHMSGLDKLDSLPSDLNGLFIVGSPETLPAMVPLCQQAGFEVHGNKLTYKGTTIDLNKGAALAVVDLPKGHCIIGLGNCVGEINSGRSRTCLTDEYGRFLRGWTEPKTSGWMTFKL